VQEKDRERAEKEAEKERLRAEKEAQRQVHTSGLNNALIKESSILPLFVQLAARLAAGCTSGRYIIAVH
jgi:hypothetical protein